ncbi:hypothetical protein [Cognatiyoonia sp. IB215182]|uniref:hypothetical protein n=1 Tax=Cognatiyoonia sp. IB215182 TaxID=3097353 RepID=UPI002A0DC582|nr:hypothetical protein [Cognatiyoonia sp. IB215182]MDX8354329.1 hypothetical protein [Cognatiyoonia sp. IB215182]
MGDRLRIAQDAWTVDMPEWVLQLAKACDRSSQNKVARKLGYNGAVVSQVLRNRYPGNMVNVQHRVEGILMGTTLICPALGELPIHECQLWRQKSRIFSNANHQRVMMYRACKRCPNNREDGA